MISVIVPVLNEAVLAAPLAQRLNALAERGMEVLVVDGGSTDDTASQLATQSLRVITSTAGRAAQMNAGANAASGDMLLFLHADTMLPEQVEDSIHTALKSSNKQWGRFDVQIAGRSRWLPVIAWMMNRRSCLTAIATGDQALFMPRLVFNAVGGFPEQPLMEDVEMCYRLKRQAGRPACCHDKVITSGRRWDTKGAWPTIWLMWQLRYAYWRGVDASQLARRYQ